MADVVRELDHVLIQGAREHNLKGVNVKIPKKKLVVITGVSGSGKSSLAFDTLYAEGQRRYVESLSAYARQFLGQLEKPQYETIRGLGPTISIEQKTTGTNPRSTVGTITEIYDYLRVLYARVGTQHCHQCGRAVDGQTAEEIAQEFLRMPEGSKVWLLAPLLVNRKGEHRELLQSAREAGFVRLRVNGEVKLSADVDALDKRRKHNVELVVDRWVAGKATESRLVESTETALKHGKGNVTAWIPEPSPSQESERVFSEHLACKPCGISFPELTPQAFSFNSPQGMCGVCNGLGTSTEISPELVIPNADLSIDEGAIAPWGEDVSEKKTWDFRSQILEHLKINTKQAVRRLPTKKRNSLLHGTGDKKYDVRWSTKGGTGTFQVSWEGLLPRLMRRFRQTESERARKWYAQFMADSLCSNCNGARLRKESGAVRVGGKSIVDVSALTVSEAERFFRELKLSGNRAQIAHEVQKELLSRIGFLSAVGLGYLSLDRPGPTLSGGEAQRIRLASQVGSELTGVIYVLDEPSIGLHQRDNDRLLNTLKRMRDIGNTVVCVEHDEDTIRAADHVIDVGPGAGVKGGEVLFSGTPAALEKSAAKKSCKSITAQFLSGRQSIPFTSIRSPKGWLKLEGVEENNLQQVDVSVPLGVLVTVTGVSGAGKSTLVNDVLCPALSRHLHGSTAKVGKHKRIEGLSQLDRVINIDQRAIGRTPRSNPITYIKVFDDIRRFFAQLPEAKSRGYSAGRFSFNVKGGRCEVCEGDGVRKIEMHFLADVFVQCESCNGKRYNRATLDITYKDHTISDVLALTVAEALELFAAHPSIRGPLSLLQQVGLEYLQLGQPSPTLSGGEAQRIKLARELSKRATGRTLYVLDEPTTGLHFEDIRKLLEVLQRLVDSGNTVLVIEHNLDMINASDYLIDMGPEGGPEGGCVIATGTPNELRRVKGSYTGGFLRRYSDRELLPAELALQKKKAQSGALSRRRTPSATKKTPGKKTAPLKKKKQPASKRKPVKPTTPARTKARKKRAAS